MDEDAPDEVLLEALVLHVSLWYGRALPLQALHYLAVEVTHVNELHDNAERLRLLVDECFLVADDVGVVDRSKDAHLIDGVLLLLIRQVLQRHHLESVELPVGYSLHFEHLAVGAVAKI